jgi:phosphatidylinositol glycan class B
MKQEIKKDLAKETKTPNELNLKKCYFCFLIFRCVSILLSRTWFVPDEYWQSQEVAHRMVFG